MKINTVGVVISHYREKYQLSQTKICEGICGVSTLWRIEKGSREVDSLVSQSLVERLGKQVLEFELLLNEKDYHRMMLRQKVKEALEEKNYKKAEEYLEKYKKIMPRDEVLHKQFYLCGKAQVHLAMDVEKTEAIEMLKEALFLTKPKYEIETEEQLFSETELKIAFLLAIFDENQKRAEYRMQQMLLFIEKYYSKAGQERLGLPILKKLIEMKKNQREEEALIQYLDKAISIISEKNKIAELAALHFEKAKAMERLFGTSEEWKTSFERPEHLKTCIRECLMAYHVADIMENNKIRDEVKQFSEEKLGWQIIE